jgi:hypothetical protein
MARAAPDRRGGAREDGREGGAEEPQLPRQALLPVFCPGLHFSASLAPGPGPIATRCPFYAPPEVHHHLHLRVAKRDLCAANWTFVSVYILQVYTSIGKSLCKNDFYCPHSITLSPRKSACNAEKTHSSATKSPATTLAPGENGRFWHQSASASRCGGSWLENLPFCPYTWLPVDRFSSQAGCV